MIKRTIYFSKPAYLSLKYKQLVVKLMEESDSPPTGPPVIKTMAIEDLGIVILDNQQITITHALLSALVANNVALIICDNNHMPASLQLPLDCNTLQSERFSHQIKASLPLKKQLWQQTIQAKLRNQAAVLSNLRGSEVGNLTVWSTKVKSGDPQNLEARGAAYYWKNMFPNLNFFRDRYGPEPNNLLNYGYAILRAIVARSLVASGLLPTLGIHHRNRYNAYCLADDIMEPYRPFVDNLVAQIHDEEDDCGILTTSIKRKLLSIPVLDVIVDGSRSPLSNGVSRTTYSLYKCYDGSLRKLVYPEFVPS